MTEVASAYSAHSTALVEANDIGPGTRIWAFAHILDGAAVGSDCNIGDHCFIEGGVKIGDGVVVKNGVSIWSGITIEDRVFVGPNVAFTNDLYPRAKAYHDEYRRTIIREGASIGANATLVCSITVGRYAMIGAGSVVTRDVPDFALVCGNPARQRGWLCRCGRRLAFPSNAAALSNCRCGISYQMLAGSVIEINE